MVCQQLCNPRSRNHVLLARPRSPRQAGTRLPKALLQTRGMPPVHRVRSYFHRMSALSGTEPALGRPEPPWNGGLGSGRGARHLARSSVKKARLTKGSNGLFKSRSINFFSLSKVDLQQQKLLVVNFLCQLLVHVPAARVWVRALHWPRRRWQQFYCTCRCLLWLQNLRLWGGVGDGARHTGTGIPLPGQEANWDAAPRCDGVEESTRGNRADSSSHIVWLRESGLCCRKFRVRTRSCAGMGLSCRTGSFWLR